MTRRHSYKISGTVACVVGRGEDPHLANVARQEICGHHFPVGVDACVLIPLSPSSIIALAFNLIFEQGSANSEISAKRRERN